jgi:DNA-binding LytR/AlgR family response regulator
MSKARRIIKAIIVDDEVPARNELKYLLEQHPDVCVISQLSSCQEALVAVQNNQPHLVFMDIQMPGSNGIAAAEKIMDMNMPPLVVFATAHEEFALKAFELNAVDYLLKPFSAKRVAQCIDKVRTLMDSASTVNLKQQAQSSDFSEQACQRNRLAIEHNAKATIIDTDEIIMACYSEGQVNIYTASKLYQCNMTLQDLQLRLGDRYFFRSHRAYLVNVEKVREIIPWFNGTYNLTLDGLLNVEIPVSRQQAPKLKKIFGL